MPTKHLLLALLAAFFTAGLSAQAPAALSGPTYEMVFKNGDRLTGRVIKKEGGKIYFHSDVVGDLVVKADLVTLTEKLSTALPSNSLVGLPPEPAKPPPPPATPIQRGGPWWFPWWVRRPFVVLTPVVTKWTGKVEFGYGNQLTNVRSVATDLRAQAERNVGPDDLLAKDVYLYGRTGQVPTTDQNEFDLQWRHNLDERLFFQSLSTYSWDKIQLINDQAEQTAELGYKFFASPTQTLNSGAGIMGQYLNATGISQRADYLGHVFEDYTYKINGRYTLSEEASAQYSPQREARFGVLLPTLGTPVRAKALNYGYKFHATLEGKVTNHLSLNLHYDYLYDNSVLDPATRSNQQITTTLGYGF